MAGKSPRVDSRRSSYCSAITIAVFVGVCLVGLWLVTSSVSLPVQTDGVSSQSNSEMKKKIANKAGQFEDIPGDLMEDPNNGDGDIEPVRVENKNEEEKLSTNKVEKVDEGDLQKGTEGGKNISDDSLKAVVKNNEQVEFKENDLQKGIEDGENISDDSLKAEVKNNEQVELKENDEEETHEGNDSDENTAAKEDQSEKQFDKSGLEEKARQENDVDLKSKGEEFPAGAQSEILNETTTQNGAFSTQAQESENEKEAQTSSKHDGGISYAYNWKLCNNTAGPDYIPCLDNVEAIARLQSTAHYEHRERHCPDESPTCLVPLLDGYKRPIKWPNSRNKIWYNNVPRTKLAVTKGHQNWVKVNGEYLTFPGGGTQFKNGALHYIDFIREAVADIAWGKRSRVILDVGCGVASFGGYQFDRDVLTMSFAPKDEHEAQVQFALERGIPAISAVMGTKRLPFPGSVFDLIHCARCRVPWHVEGGTLLLELNRVLRPGGYFVWSATPVYRKGEEDVGIWKAMSKLTKSMCWELITIRKDKLNQVGAAIYKKPASNNCYKKRSENNPPLCPETDDPNAAWNVPLQTCVHQVPQANNERGNQWPELWPQRLEKTPYWLKDSQIGVYGKPAPADFDSDNQHWKHVVSNSYLKGMGITWSRVRNVMDMRSVYGGFAAALKKLNVWVMNVVSIDAPDTLPIIYERGLFGIYHDWCESFSTYPRTYDLLHADHLFSKIQKRCKVTSVIAEVDRILRPEGTLIVRDEVKILNQLEDIVKSLQWEIRLTYTKEKEGILCVQKTFWRPKEIEVAPTSASIA